MDPKLKNRLFFMGGFLVYFGVLWSLWDTALIYPLKIFVVFLHEVSHAMAAVATGGSVERILLDPHQGGAAYTVGGNGFLTLSAGYLGSLLWGVLFILAWHGARHVGSMGRLLRGFLAPMAFVGVVCALIVTEDLGTAALVGCVSVLVLVAAAALPLAMKGNSPTTTS